MERKIEDVDFEIRKGKIMTGDEMYYLLSPELKSIDPIHFGKVFEPHNTLFFSGMVYGLPDNFVMLDIGANIGYYSVLCNVHRPDAEIYSFEPHNKVFEVLSMNSQKDNMHPYHCGIGKETKKATLYCDNRNVGGHSFTNDEETWGDKKGFQPDIGMYKIESDIKNIREFDIDWDRVNVLKIDTQGLEVEILEDIFPLVKSKCFVFVEKCEGLMELTDGFNLKEIYNIGRDYVYFKK